MSHIRQLTVHQPWDDDARIKMNLAIRDLNTLETSIPADIATHNADAAAHTAAMTALKAASNTWSNTNNFTGALQLAGVGLLAGLRGHIAGLTLSNNVTDPTNDVDIAVGAAVAADQSALMVLSSALIKRLDASWVVGTNQGMLDGTESVAGTPDVSTWYHIWLIRRSDTGVVDVLASESATAPTMPANYDQKRRIGTVYNDSAGDILAFTQSGDIFLRAAATDRNSTSAVSSALLTFSVPTGILVKPIVRISLLVGASVNTIVRLGSAAAGSASTVVAQTLTGAGDSSDIADFLVPPLFTTNTSAQIYHEQSNSTGTPTTSLVITYGWIDDRGRHD